METILMEPSLILRFFQLPRMLTQVDILIKIAHLIFLINQLFKFIYKFSSL